VEPLQLVNGQRTLVYSCTVRADGTISGTPLGVLGIIFAWDRLGQTVVTHTPLSAQEWEHTRACITDEDGYLLADSQKSALGGRVTFDGMTEFLHQASGALTTIVDGRTVRIAHAASPGYETYRTGWHSLLIRAL
jgi:hypothetical protein